MSFICIFRLNNGALSKKDEVIFLEFIDSSFDIYHETPTKIAKVTFNGKEAVIYSTCPSYISSKAHLVKGERVTEETKIGYFSAEGENIPYDKPYAIVGI